MTKDILEIKTIHLTMGVSKKYDVDENTMHYGALNATMFIDFLREMKLSHNKKYILFGNSCPVHKAA